MPGTDRFHDRVMRAAFGKAPFPNVTAFFVALTVAEPPSDVDTADLVDIEPENRVVGSYTRLANGTPVTAQGQFSSNLPAGSATTAMIHGQDTTGYDLATQIAPLRPGDVFYVTVDPAGADREFYRVGPGAASTAGGSVFTVDVDRSGFLVGSTPVPAGAVTLTVAQRFMYRRIATTPSDWVDVAANVDDATVREIRNGTGILFPAAVGGSWGTQALSHFAVVVDPAGGVLGPIAGEVWWYGPLTDLNGIPTPVPINDGEQLALPVGGLVCDLGPRATETLIPTV